MEIEKTDFLIIGSGVAGLRAAIELAPHGRVIVVTKDQPEESSTGYAQGGVAVALSDEDEVSIHYEDTIRAGDGLCITEAVESLVTEGPERIRELIEWGVEFDKEGAKLDFTLEAAHSKRRVLHAHGDATGKEIERVLINKVMTFQSVSKYSFAFAVDLIIENGECFGAYIMKEGAVKAVVAKATILSTGGAGQVFSRTTNPFVATGDGMAVGYRAGAVLENMEFVQFHPTALFSPSSPQFLLSETMRGEGALLKNIHGKRFMTVYHPDGELAPRDVVSRAIASEMISRGASHVYLDLTHLDKGYVKKRFPAIYATCLTYDFDITARTIPVSPAAHYMMGGVKTDTHARTNIKGLFAAGETACVGVHGANRLASNSLLEGLVFGARAGRAAVGTSLMDDELHAIAGVVASASRRMRFGSVSQYDEIRSGLRKVMWEKVGIIRCEDSLNAALRIFDKWRWILDKMFMSRRELELKNMLQVAFLVTEAAVERRCSIGAHYRSDYKQRENCDYSIRMRKDKGIAKKSIIN